MRRAGRKTAYLSLTTNPITVGTPKYKSDCVSSDSSAPGVGDSLTARHVWWWSVVPSMPMCSVRPAGDLPCPSVTRLPGWQWGASRCPAWQGCAHPLVTRCPSQWLQDWSPQDSCHLRSHILCPCGLWVTFHPDVEIPPRCGNLDMPLGPWQERWSLLCEHRQLRGREGDFPSCFLVSCFLCSRVHSSVCLGAYYMRSWNVISSRDK